MGSTDRGWNCALRQSYLTKSPIKGLLFPDPSQEAGVSPALPISIQSALNHRLSLSPLKLCLPRISPEIQADYWGIRVEMGVCDLNRRGEDDNLPVRSAHCPELTTIIWYGHGRAPI